MFIEENPISLLDDDKLNRREFAESLAQAISNYKKESCLTISLMGKWGSGKTSIINMVKNYWKNNDSNNIVIHFNPWYFSNNNNLLFQFFDILVNSSGKDFTDYVNTDNLKKLGKSLINMTSFSLNFGLGSISINPEVNNSLSDEETLLSLKNKISDDFKNLKKKVIIIIDDIDRLSDDEVKQIMMLVKSLADFPHVVYILSFDKDAVVGSLKNLKVYNPDMFLEKIIQIPIVVPEIRASQLDKLVTFYLDDFYKKYRDVDETYQKDFFDIYSYLRLFFDNLRDLYRYINIITFYFSVFKDDVNINDFMLILAVQLFEHKIYNKIKDNPDLFLVSTENQKDDIKEDNKNKIQEIIGLHSKLSEDEIYHILLKLFPRIRMYYRNIDLEDSYRDWKYNFRICTTEFFYNYFTLNLEAEDLSATSIDDLFKLDDVEKISEMFLEHDRNNQTKDLFDIIINRMRDIPKENAHYFIDSLIDIGDQLHVPLNTFFDKKVYLSRILDDLLKKYDNNSERFDVLQNAIDNSENSLYVAIEILSDQDFIYNRFTYENDRKDVSEALIDENDLEKLEDMMVLKIRKWDETDKLWDSLDLEFILDSWELWDSEIDVVKRVKEFISEGKNALRFARGFRNINSTTIHADSPSEIVQKFNLKSMVKYFESIDDLRSKYVEVCNNESLDDNEKEICASLIKQIDEDYFTFQSGQKPGVGTYICINCNQEIMLDDSNDALPPCPNCNGVEFKKIN
nr:P-loop NTPase fold protein [uncultured Methanobrevibacter sp.]